MWPADDAVQLTVRPTTFIPNENQCPLVTGFSNMHCPHRAASAGGGIIGAVSIPLSLHIYDHGVVGGGGRNTNAYVFDGASNSF